LSRIEDGVYVNGIFRYKVVNRKRESLADQAMKALVGFVNASVDSQRLDVSRKTVVEERAQARLL
jgi:hypothetical protein